jgi:hypothetical protein
LTMSLQVIFIHRNIPGVLRKGNNVPIINNTFSLTWPVNEILGDHNVDKQMTDSRGDVSPGIPESSKKELLTRLGRVPHG